jgi:Tol biopolymer transport system component
MTRLLTLLGCIALVVAASAQSAAHTVAATTVRVSVSSHGAQGNLPSWVEGISADSRWVVFSSASAGLVHGDTNERQDAFVRDRRTGKTIRVSVTSRGRQAAAARDPFGGSVAEGISANGRFVVFRSDAANLVAGDTNRAQDIFVRDRKTGRTTRVSVGNSGRQASGRSDFAVISPNGRYVAFSSEAPNLVAGDTNRAVDVFLRDRIKGTTQRVSLGGRGKQANGESEQPSISADGRYVAFQSNASNLVPGDTNGLSDVFVRDRKSGRTTRISVDSHGRQGAGDPTRNGSNAAAISGDGRYVVFHSAASNLVRGDTNHAFDIFVHDLETGTTDRVSISSSGAQADAESLGPPVISADGHYVAFASLATNLVPGDKNDITDTFVRDLRAGKTTLVSLSSGGAQGTDSSWPNGVPAFSAGSRYLAFSSWAGNLVSGDTNGTADAFVRDLRSVIASPVSFAAVGGPANDNRANATAVSGPPLTVSGTTVGATEEPGDPRTACGRTKATVWYRLSDAPSGRLVLRFTAFGDLDANISVYSAVRSRLTPLACDLTDNDGHGALSFMTAPGQKYLIMVGREPSSDDGGFKFTLFRPEPSSKPPGALLPRRGVRSSVDALSDFDDAWSLQMRTGITYRMNLAPARGACVTLSLYRPGTRSFADAGPLKVLHCGGYLTYTPGQGASGRYTVLVTATGTRPGRQRYRLQAALAGPDDMAPGVRIENLETRRGSLSGIDVVDLYRFRVLEQSDVTLTLAGRISAHLILLGETGRHITSSGGTGGLSMRLSPGRYFVVVRADGAGHGRYRLSLLERGITTTTVLANGARVADVAPGSSVAIVVAVNFSSTGTVRLQIDRFDPLSGWHFLKLYRLRLGGSGRTGIAFRPPTVGRWRVRASFGGSRTASPSVGGTAMIVVND